MKIDHCPGTLAEEFSTYSRTCLKRVFDGRKVLHVLPYEAPNANLKTDKLFEDNQKRISISGVQEKFSILLEKNKLRLIKEEEQGTHILKPIPRVGKKNYEMPANEHLTMQIARQVYNIETAENALIFFENGAPAYITKRFDVSPDGSKKAKEDFATLAGKTPQTHGEHYKYEGNYLELFQLMKKFLPAYRVEIPKLFKLLLFNFLFSNGDAHLKNFAILETPFGDHRLSPAYDLLNTRIHVDDSDFALDEGLLPKSMGQTITAGQFKILAEQVELKPKQFDQIMADMMKHSEEVIQLTHASFLKEATQRNYIQDYQYRLKQLQKINS
ncbi:type II toxin-antitoxin system HipA family toxin [Salegentibacter salegens]|uniref:Serine/threonine-protein kinase HipA n=1 Tax=Salegentibacter salegens TaxID=143223 RepID=A0A1M7K8K7_9FLAO|nr:HipA domain-containing protein [Salegentibacter salegens]PRX44408.1 serine/threonine-protein kinase HipA [Salegentibacter salegens]SHM61554.1 serine/threonine-protein kinase HipA [Salegentibacter salegens]